MGTETCMSPDGNEPTGFPGWGTSLGGLGQRGKWASPPMLVPHPALMVQYGGTSKRPICELPSDLKWFVWCFARFHGCFPIFHAVSPSHFSTSSANFSVVVLFLAGLAP